MLLKNRSFPYPVLAEWTDDFTDGSKFEVRVEPRISRRNESLEVHFFVTLRNNALESYVQQQKASVVCNVECCETAFRKSIKLNPSGEETCEIFKKGEISGKVEFCPAIIALEDIEDYQNTFSFEYGDKIRIEAGLMLAIGRQCSINVEVSKKSPELVPSIFSLSPLPANCSDNFGLGENAAPIKFDIDYSGDQINVKVSKELYWKCKNLIASKEKFSIVSSLIYLPVVMMLVSKFQTMLEQEDDDFSEYENSKWFLSLNARVQKLFGCDLRDRNLFNPPSRVMEIASRILEDPVCEAINAFVEQEEE